VRKLDRHVRAQRHRRGAHGRRWDGCGAMARGVGRRGGGFGGQCVARLHRQLHATNRMPSSAVSLGKPKFLSACSNARAKSSVRDEQASKLRQRMV
jgi:hypothetical protein